MPPTVPPAAPTTNHTASPPPPPDPGWTEAQSTEARATTLAKENERLTTENERLTGVLRTLAGCLQGQPPAPAHATVPIVAAVWRLVQIVDTLPSDPEERTCPTCGGVPAVQAGIRRATGASCGTCGGRGSVLVAG